VVACASKLCTALTAIAPSPTAKATRLAVPLRQSPAANTGGQAGFERKRWPPFMPVGQLRDRRTCEQEALRFSGDGRGQEVGSRFRADEDE